MASLNKCFIMGRLGQDPELRYTQTQTPVVTLNVATSEFRSSKDGQRQEQTEWHRIVVWGKQAENCNKYLKKGRAVFVEGRIQTRSWDDKNGQKRYATDIVANNVQFMPSSAPSQYGGQSNGGEYEAPLSADPFASPSPGGYGASQGGDTLSSPNFPKADNTERESSFGQSTPSLDDIPF